MRRALGFACAAMLVPVMLMSQGQAAAPAFASPKSLQESNVTEPGIDIGPASVSAPGGSIIVNGPAGFPGHTRLWRSTNGGSSYQKLSITAPFNQLPGGGDGDVAITESGRIYFLDLWVGSNSLARSDDGGQTWSFGTPLTTLPASDRQWIAVGGPGDTPGTDTVYIIYALIEQPRYMMIARSKDSGTTWTYHQIVPGGTAFTGQVVSDASGFVGVIYHQNDNMYFARSSNEGQSWASEKIAGNAFETMPSVAMAGGTIYATWISKDGTWAVMESRSTDGGETWSTPRRISNAGTTNMFSWVDARGGKAAIAWYGTETGVGDPNTNNGPWYVKYSESLDSGVNYTAPVNAAVEPAKTSPICTMGLTCTTTGPGNRELGDFMQLAIDRQGNSIVVYNYVFGTGQFVVRSVKQTS